MSDLSAIDAVLKSVWDSQQLSPALVVTPISLRHQAEIRAALSAVEVQEQEGFYEMDRRRQKRLINRARREARKATRA